MENFINKVLSNCIEGFVLYDYKGSYWIVHPEKNLWVAKIAYSGYTFFNYFFFVLPNVISTALVKSW